MSFKLFIECPFPCNNCDGTVCSGCDLEKIPVPGTLNC